MPDAGHAYTPTGRSAVFDVPAYDDNADLRILFQRFADTAAAHDGDTYTGVHDFTGSLRKDGLDVVTVSGSQTVSGKTITGAAISGGTIDVPSIKKNGADVLTAAELPASNITVTAKTASWTAAVADANTMLTFSSSSALTLTIAPDSTANLALGASLLIARLGAGTVQVLAGSGVTLMVTPGSYLRAQYSMATAVKIAGNTWLLSGDVSAS